MPEEDSLPFHHWLLSDPIRTGAYRNAVSKIVHKNDVVLDIGAGSGILSFFACQAGARKVYAIEISDALSLARELCTSNGFDGIVEFRQGLSQEIELPERVDVVISDTGCSFGLQGGLLGILLDAKKRFLKPGGLIIPGSLELLVAPVEFNDERSLNIWDKNRYGLDLSAVRPFAANTNYSLKLEAKDMLAPPASLATIQFAEVDHPYVAGEAISVAARDGVLHGLGAWMRLELAPGIGFTNSPLEAAVDWTHSFFPVEMPVEVLAGDRVRAKIQTNNGEVWRWQVQVMSGKQADANASAVKARFDQSTLGNFPIAAEHLKKQLPDYPPKLSRKGEAEKYLLSVFNGQRSAGELAAELQKRFADCFPTREAASQFVIRVIGRCT